MEIRQLSVDYNEEHDRILIRINTTDSEELRFWLTQRMLGRLWPTFNEVVARHLLPHDKFADHSKLQLSGLNAEQRAMVAEFERVDALKQADFATPYDAHPLRLPLGEFPLLVTEVNLTAVNNGQLRIRLCEQLSGKAQQRSCQLDLPPQLVHGLTHLLHKAIARSGWNVSMYPAENQPAESPANDPGRPRYLN